MIALYGSGPNFGLPDASPFVTKAEILLLMSGLSFEKKQMSLSKAPKGKMPYIDDNGRLLGDSTFIRWHLEDKYNVDFDKGLNTEQRAVAWAFEKMAEDHLYWLSMHARWTDDANFGRGPAVFFKGVPAPLRPLIAGMVRRSVRKNLHGQGTGRHESADLNRLGERAIRAIAEYLGDKQFFMGDAPTGVDASMFAFAASALCPVFESDLQRNAARHNNLKRYVSRMTARFYPDWPEIAGCKAIA